MWRKQLDREFLEATCIYIAIIRGGADKSLARPGRKQATATKLGIYSTYSPRSWINFLARYSNLCEPPKKIQKLSIQPGFHGSNGPPRRTKNGDLLIFFSVQGTGGSATGPDPENRVGDQDIGSPGRPVSCGLQVPGEPGHCDARTRFPWWPSSLCKKKRLAIRHMNRHLFPTTLIDFVLRHREICRAKDLSAPPRTFWLADNVFKQNTKINASRQSTNKLVYIIPARGRWCFCVIRRWK